MKTVVIKGPLLTQSGYGVHARQIARWLIERPDVDVKIMLTPWGDTPWIVNREPLGGLIDEIMKRSVGPGQAQNCDVSFQIQLPNEWDKSLAKKNIGVTAGVETDKCNPAWITACNEMHEIIVPSQHTKNCLEATGNVIKPIHIIPESFSDSCVKNDLEIDLDVKTKFNFLVFGQLTGNNPFNDRKNTFNTIKWLCEAFADDPDVGIIVKTNAGRNTKIDRSIVTTIFKQLLGDVRKTDFPKIHILHGEMSDDQVAAVYRNADVKAIVSATKGEGYGLPLLEASASGLPVIATDWSGHLDFLKRGKFVELYYSLTPIHQTRVDNAIFMQGSRWAEVQEEDFKKKVIKFRKSSATPKEWALDLQKKIIAEYNFTLIKELYNSSMKEVV